METGGVDRRHLLRGAGVVALSGWAGGATSAQLAGGTAVVFLSRSGNTRTLAGHLSRRFGADLVEIRPRDPWPEDYEEMVAWANQWRESERLLPLAATPDLSGYRTVFLGFPVWGMALPAPMRSLLARTDLSDKSVLIFVTHGGYGAGSSLEGVRRLAPRASLCEPFVLECDQERSSLDARCGDGLTTSP